MGKITWIDTLTYKIFGFFEIYKENTNSLYISKFKDIKVLSQAGMHLTVIDIHCRPCAEKAVALLHVNELDKALDVVSSLHTSLLKAPLIGHLAFICPASALKLINERELEGKNIDNIITYCKQKLPLEYCNKQRTKTSILHQFHESLFRDKKDEAKRNIISFFNGYGLSPPDIDLSSNGINLNAIKAVADRKYDSDILVSIVVAFHNEEKYLHIAIESLLNQSWNNIEIIIVDDGSTDCTLELCNEYALKDNRIKVVHLEHNVGLWKAKNIGFRNVTGDVITMHDADDWSHPEKITEQVLPIINNKKLMATSSNFFRVDAKTGLPFTRNACNYIRWNPSSFMFRKEVLQYMGNFIHGLLGSDAEFIARLEFNYGLKSHHRIKLPLSIGLQRQDSLSNLHRASGLSTDIKRIKDWEYWRRLHVAHLPDNKKIQYLNESYDN